MKIKRNFLYKIIGDEMLIINMSTGEIFELSKEYIDVIEKIYSGINIDNECESNLVKELEMEGVINLEYC
ncbi:hypothetical protein SAMN02745784_00986 [Tissierella praeacuta DSM 18095]|uniref:Uncharacterized protein n=1 Tax=Tissierella praeacuta DSM 18095 TaxID=1123404 RepID=A0A1M4UBI3_9FIRM|nr:hypothetical protein [Tissierella praeacuta]TCU77256.1 hypothetical protein EV204_102115 [Tissierella praeacuta]SHE53900.1 hypothetical protein SAMN02745784_00986 [Tissierella praeacuta DSM 18095]SUP04049.1 Uncharacterised protein [Tissierella praeacuta]